MGVRAVVLPTPAAALAAHRPPPGQCGTGGPRVQRRILIVEPATGPGRLIHAAAYDPWPEPWRAWLVEAYEAELRRCKYFLEIAEGRVRNGGGEKAERAAAEDRARVARVERNDRPYFASEEVGKNALAALPREELERLQRHVEEVGRRDRTNPATLAKFNRIEDGMTYEQVKAIMGVGGEHVSHVGVAGTTADVVAWKNQDGSNMLVTFSNGRVAGKAQFGLR